MTEPDTANSIPGHGFPSNTEDYDPDRGYFKSTFQKKIKIFTGVEKWPGCST